MGMNLILVKVEALKYHIYEGSREKGEIYSLPPADAEKLEKRKLVKIVRKESLKPSV